MITENKDLGKDKEGLDIFAQVNWTINDVKQSAEINNVTITDEEALKILKDNEDWIIDGMCEYGGNVLDGLVEMGNYPEIEQED